MCDGHALMFLDYCVLPVEMKIPQHVVESARVFLQEIAATRAMHDK